MEKLAGDLLFGLKLVKLSILPMQFIQVVKGRLGELRSGYLGFKGSKITGGPRKLFQLNTVEP